MIAQPWARDTKFEYSLSDNQCFSYVSYVLALRADNAVENHNICTAYEIGQGSEV